MANRSRNCSRVAFCSTAPPRAASSGSCCRFFRRASSAPCSSNSSSAKATTASAKAISRRCSNRSSATSCGVLSSRPHEPGPMSPRPDVQLDETHDAALSSWVAAANDPATDFPIQNLPFGRFRRRGETKFRIGVAIGDQVLDLAGAALIDTDDMNAFMQAGATRRNTLRSALSEALRTGSPKQRTLQACLVPQTAVEMGLPCLIGDYTDFYTSIHHATNVGRQFRPDNPLLPNYRWIPIGYHGRASSIGVSTQSIRRPAGQFKGPDDAAPSVGPTRRLDYELELGAFIASGNAQGEPIPIADAEAHLFGLALFNDWPPRDIQAWEYQPLGPFLSKNFASTLSPWIVTMEALAPFRVPFARTASDPQPLPYLDDAGNRAAGALDVALEAWISTSAMRAATVPPQRLMQANF